MYGENGGKLRAELAILLRQHRIQQRLGGPGTYRVPETTTIEQRQQLGAQIRRYRHTVLTWCLQAAEAAVSPRITLDGTRGDPRGPAKELRRRLATAVEASTTGRPTLQELTTHQRFAMVETWRQAARAAALGEQDFTADMSHGHLDHGQCMTVLKDVAEITRALVSLDRRYANIPGWKNLNGQRRLTRLAEVCATFAGRHEPDYTVDHRGWHPPAALIEAASRPGLGGIVQGEHNLLVHLKQFPDAHSMRLVLDSQRIVSHEAATRVQSVPAIAAKWAVRAETFTLLLQQTRDIRGRLGNGGPAAAQGAITADRAQHLTPNGPTDNDKALRELDRLFAHIDTRLAQIIEDGVSQRLYLLRVKLPRIDSEAGSLVHPVRARCVPIDSPVQTDLLKMVRTHLRPPPEQPRAPEGARQGRLNFEAALIHRPGETDPGLSL